KGPAAGGTSVTITGTGFTGATAVHFGSMEGTEVDVLNDTAINVTTPAQAAGAYDVTVTTPNGTSSASDADRFTVTATPAVTGLSPTSGPAHAQTPVTITGHGFTNADLVMFGSTGITDFTVVDDHTITLVAPFDPAGTYHVLVHVQQQGSTPDTPADVFTMVAPPAVSSIAPTSGSVTGGTSVTLTGTDFTGATSVLFGSVPATRFTVVNSTTITAVSPAESVGVSDVTVTTPAGTSGFSDGDRFTSDPVVVPSPVVTGVSPDKGLAAGGTSVTITGTGFADANAVLFGNALAGVPTVNAAGTTIEVVSPKLTAGTYDIVVQGPNGASSTVTADKFTAVASPVVASPVVATVSPASGPTTGGTTVTITGTGLTGATSVKFGTLAAKSFVVVSSTKITAVAPAEAAGVYNLEVTTAGGPSKEVTADRYTVLAAPKVSAISPASGPATGGTSVTISGTGFNGATKVEFGTNAAHFTVKSSTSIVATSPVRVAGISDVRVATPGGTSSVVSADRFTSVAAPKVTHVTPASGPATGHSTVTITGTGFTKATRVRFGSVGAHFVVKSSTKIVAVSPAQSAGVRNVTVTTIGGTSMAVTADRFTYVKKK
ncbi:MAG: large repetitive protein, partial [Micromonosporaceae bacterium]|nr:large repetitive protein [Micromonosporaceae bacterium]